MKLKRDTKFEEQSTQRFKIGIRNLTNCDPITQKVSKIFILMSSLWAKYMLFELKICRGIILFETERGYKIWRGINFSFQNRRKEFDKFWPEPSKVSKIFTLMGSFWAKYILFGLKKYRRIIFHETEMGYKTWRGIDLSFENWHKKFDKFWSEHSKVSKIFTLTLQRPGEGVTSTPTFFEDAYLSNAYSFFYEILWLSLKFCLLSNAKEFFFKFWTGLLW